ncbi:MAG: hypothetical protein M3460_04640 [Actinomycetota bacterium]|nr:hypothetical protein [Actinomycetota bacterium]
MQLRPGTNRALLEHGQRGFNRRGLLEDLAEALSCSVADLTGQPYLPVDRQSADAAATIPGIGAVLHDTTLDDVLDVPARDVLDVPARPLPELVRAAAQANAYADDTRYAMAGQNLGAVLTELHVHAVTGDSQQRQQALAALAEACMVAYCLAYRIGHADLAVVAARRGFDAASRAERPDLVGMLAMSRTVALMRVGARRHAASVCADVLGEISALPGPTADDTTVAEACGDPTSDVGPGRRTRRPRQRCSHASRGGSIAGCPHRGAQPSPLPLRTDERGRLGAVNRGGERGRAGRGRAFHCRSNRSVGARQQVPGGLCAFRASPLLGTGRGLEGR